MKTYILIILMFIAQLGFCETEVYFSPYGGAKDKIISCISEAKESIDLMIFTFTSKDLADALIEAKKRGVKVRIIADKFQSQGKYAKISYLSKSIKVKIIKGIDRGIMHNKVAIFDKQSVITGSYNWTVSAEQFNYENTMYIDDIKIVELYASEFNRIWEK